jgi:hypothetical protein
LCREISRINKQETKQHMKKLGTSMIALGVAGAMFATASAEANDKARSSIELGQQRKARVAFVANSQPQRGTKHPEARYDFGDAASYENAHPGDGG